MSETEWMEIGQTVTVKGRDMEIASYYDSGKEARRRAILVGKGREKSDQVIAEDVIFVVDYLNNLLATEGMHFDLRVVNVSEHGRHDHPHLLVESYRRLG